MSKAPTTTFKHKQYGCRVCRKVDRKARMVAHVFKHHVPMDRIPYVCSLCNFRCQDKATLLNHVTQYQRHRTEVSRLGITDQSTVLQKSQNPVDPNTFMYALDGNLAYLETTSDVPYDIFEEDSEEPTLPDWLEDAGVVQTAASIGLTPVSSIASATPTVPGSAFPVGFSPLMTSPAVTMDHSGVFTSTTLQAQVPVECSPPMSASKGPKRFAAPTSMSTSLSSQRSIMDHGLTASVFNSSLPIPPFTSNNGIHIATAIASEVPLPTTTTLSMPTIESLLATPKVSTTCQIPSFSTNRLCTNVTPVNATIGSTLDQTPVQDEVVVVFDGRLDTSIDKDPLYIEGLNANINSAKSTAERKTQTSTELEKTSKGDEILRSILRAIENNGRELRNVQRSVISVVDEIRSVKRTIVSLERSIARQRKPAPAPRRSRTPLFRSPHNKKIDQPSGSRKVKSAVKKI